MLLHAGDDGVVADVFDGENARCAALLREQREAVFDGLARVAVAADLAVELDRAALARGVAEDVLQRLGAARPRRPPRRF